MKKGNKPPPLKPVVNLSWDYALTEFSVPALCLENLNFRYPYLQLLVYYLFDKTSGRRYWIYLVVFVLLFQT